MSCHLLPCIQLIDVCGLQEYLFPDLRGSIKSNVKQKNKDTAEKEEADGWDEDWDDWEEDAEEGSRETTPDTDQEGEATSEAHRWLQECLVSVSPAADLIAVARKDKLVLLSPKYNADSRNEEVMSQYHTVWSGSVVHNSEEQVTAVMCLPLASQKRSTQGGPDWTCVLLGFSSGFLRFYTETGTLLLSQKLHNEPVQKLKCNTYTPKRYLGIAEQHEELVILYKRVLVTIDGFSLYQALKACRNQVARATASGETSLQPPPLAYKKWAPQDMESVSDTHTTGMHTPNPFDQMVLASLNSHTSAIRTNPPAASIYLMVGVGPYTGFFYAIEGSSQPILSEVAFAVASKLKSAIMSAASGWLTFGSKSKAEGAGEKQPKIEPATPLPLKFGLPDQRRAGLCVSLSPNNTYAATTDSFGRVILIDVAQGVAARMWKGYRDAQVGWVEVREEEGPHSASRQSRSAQFLVIYAARRGILEIWLAGNGPRVAAFNVSKHCQLVSISHGILGLNNVTCKGVRIKAFQVALIEPNGTLKTVQVPFHLALSDRNNKRVRDMHLLKKLKQVLKENTEQSESLNAQVRDLLLNIRIPSIAQQGVDKVLNTSYLDPDFMEGILKACTKRLKVAGEDEGNIERRLFLQYCHLQETLIHTYREIRHLKSSKAAPTTDTQSLADLLGLQESEAEHLSSLVDRYLGVAGAGRSGAHVHFQDDMVTSAATFLACFTCTPHTTDTGSAGAISLSKDLPDEKKLELGSFLFESCVKYQGSPSDVCAVIKNSGVPLTDIGHLLMWTWVSEAGRTVDQLPGLYNLLKIISSNIDADVMASSSDQESSWWHGLREMCSHSSLCLSSYLGSMVSKAVAMEMLGLAPKTENRDQDLAAKDPDADTISMCETPSPVVEKSPSPTEEMAESTPVDIEAWNLLCKQLEDLTDIDCFLKLSSSEHMQVVNQSEELKVNVAAMLDGGKGCISEIVARHIARVGYLPQDLYKPLQEEQAGQAGDKTYSASEQAVLDAMDSLRRRFPHSLENDTLFSNCCWEYAVLWNKLPEEVNNFKVALDYLRLIQNAMLRQGVCSLMWHMFTGKKFQATAQLMEKVGKVPKDRLCRKEIGISEVRLGLFVGGVVDFLSIVMDANCETNEVPVFNLEQIWAQVKGSVSLVELAIDQKGTNYGLLTVFHQLATLMQAVITFNMKPVKVLSLFDSKGRHSLSQDLHNHPLLPNTNIDSSITVQRKQFMTRVITQAVIKMRESCPLTSAMESGSPPNTTTSKLRLSEAGRWPEVIMTLADQSGQDVDYFKRHYVCELYSAGFDRLADEVLVTVNEREPLGTQLLTIAGQRVAYKLSVMDAQMVVDLMSNVNPALSTWLKSMNWALLLQAEVDNADIASLVRHSVSLLPEGHQQYELAAALDTLTCVL
ncbi:rab3 GTPase-activating protein non-catalytic subunit-like isoform X1 [Mya arenaria]|uniref:rab3 GTPase-activating protein non-catalytic subunit-like isoform X1 n=1 Tax=Mya arenaria TaxID=6604 RepID=UPI0022DFBD37|nr:rab3 GTPase-activating protein non-catalytic subunit-like isoform X1 [Mya arenaria]